MNERAACSDIGHGSEHHNVTQYSAVQLSFCKVDAHQLTAELKKKWHIDVLEEHFTQ